MTSPPDSQAVVDSRERGSCAYRSCPWCRNQWLWDDAPHNCPTCSEPLHAGTIETAQRRAYARGF